MKTQKAIDAIRSGGFLMAEYDENDQSLKYRCVPGGGVTPKQANSIIDQLKLKPQNDCLFEGMPSQTWRP
mgnify:CR=1 FL=1